MKDFDFSKEMVNGKKHMKKLEYNPNDYKFIELVTELFQSELNNLHNNAILNMNYLLQSEKILIQNFIVNFITN